MSSSAASGRMRAPAGYYGPRLAVGAAATVGAVAVYEMVSGYLAPEPIEAVGDSWDEDWDSIDDGLLLSTEDGPMTPLKAAVAAAVKLRVKADNQVGHRHVIFVRHAQPEGEGGSIGTVGKRQAELTGLRLKSLFDEVATVYHSSAGEAKATAQIIQGCLGKKCRVTESALLAEGVPIMPSPAPSALSNVALENLVLDSARAEGAFRAHVWCPTGEQQERVSVEVVVSHGNVIRYLVCRALQLPEPAWSRLAANHCAVTWLDIDSEGAVVLREFGGVGHLPPDLVTYH